MAVHPGRVLPDRRQKNGPVKFIDEELFFIEIKAVVT